MKIKDIELNINHLNYSFSVINFDWRSYEERSSNILGVKVDVSQKTWVQKRKAGYLAGRFCAKKALQEAGYEQPSIPIPVSPDRSPVWPCGWVGSISHTDNMACVGVAPSSKLKGIGLDIENFDKIIEEELFISEIFLESERLFIEKIDSNIIILKQLLILIFSMKESIYKCFYPLTVNGTSSAY